MGAGIAMEDRLDYFWVREVLSALYMEIKRRPNFRNYTDFKNIIYKVTADNVLGHNVSPIERQVIKAVVVFYDKEQPMHYRLGRIMNFVQICNTALMSSRLTEDTLSNIIVNTKKSCHSSRNYISILCDKFKSLGIEMPNDISEQEAFRFMSGGLNSDRFNRLIDSSTGQRNSQSNVTRRASQPNNNRVDTSKLTESDKQLLFAAQAYYKTEKFAEQNGYSSGLVRTMTESTLNELRDTGKIDNQALRKFNDRLLPYIISNGLTQLDMGKYTAKIAEVLLGGNPGLSQSQMRSSFMKWFKDCGIRVTEAQARIIYSSVLYSLGEAFMSDAFKSMAKSEINELGINRVVFESSPKIIISSDGCSHQTWGSLIGHMDAANKY